MGIEDYKVSSDGCWEFQGHISSNGYGRVKINKKALTTHRVSWEVNVGEIPEGKCVLHKCDKKHCINPEHLYLGDQVDVVQKTWDFGGKSHKKLTTDTQEK